MSTARRRGARRWKTGPTGFFFARAGRLHAATTNLKLGRTRAISGSVSPAGAGRSVRMTIYTPGTAPNVTRTLALDGASRYRFAYGPKAPGKYSVSVSFVKDADHLGSISPLKSFRAVR